MKDCAASYITVKVVSSHSRDILLCLGDIQGQRVLESWEGYNRLMLAQAAPVRVQQPRHQDSHFIFNPALKCRRYPQVMPTQERQRSATASNVKAEEPKRARVGLPCAPFHSEEHDFVECVEGALIESMLYAIVLARCVFAPEDPWLTKQDPTHVTLPSCCDDLRGCPARATRATSGKRFPGATCS